MSNLSPFRDFLERFGTDPILFVKEVLKYEPQEWQQELLEQVALGTRKISVRSGHGCGKSAVVSWVMLSRAESPESLQGIHADWVLICCDEASGIPESVYESGMGSMSGHQCTTILTSNPTRTSGFFYDTWHRNRSDWHGIHISCLDSPLVSQDYIEEMGRRYQVDSPIYAVRVLGDFPLVDSDAIIALDLVTSSITRDVEPTWTGQPV